MLINSNKNSIYDHEKRLDVIEKDIKIIPSNSIEIINIKNTIKNYNTNIKIPDIENDIVSLKDDVKNNTTNIKNNYNITQINKKIRI